MISGIHIEVPEEYGSEISHFLGYFYRADLNYEILTAPDDDDSNTEPLILFNSCKTVRIFKNRLDENYSNASIEIEQTLSETYYKFDKGFYIDQLIIEVDVVKDLFSISNDGTIKHLNFKLLYDYKDNQTESNLINESDCQGYYQLMIQYIKKMHSLLLRLHDTIVRMN